MVYKHKGGKYFDYENEQEIEAIWKKLFEWGFRFVVQSKYNNLQSKFNSNFNNQNNKIKDIYFNSDYEKISLGIGIEFLLKANVLKSGFVVHKINNQESTNKICELKEENEIDYNHMLSFEYIKNHLAEFCIKTEEKTIKTLELIQKWRNGIIHQANGPQGEDSKQWVEIQNTFVLLNNQLVEENE